MLPKRLYYTTNMYLVPWFFQNLAAFAPDPPINRHVLVYRINIGGNWGGWRYPAFRYLNKQWKNRLDIATKTHDQLELVGDHLYWTAKRFPGNGIYSTNEGVSLPAVRSAQKVINMHLDSAVSIDSFQLAVWVQHIRSDDGQVVKSDSALFYPKYQWIE